jgi:hypothetical protein
MADKPIPDSWAQHPRWADHPRCRECGQPLIHAKSIALGICARHRPSSTLTLAEMDLPSR